MIVKGTIFSSQVTIQSKYGSFEFCRNSIEHTSKCQGFEFHKIHVETIYQGARGVMVIVIGNGHNNTSSNPKRD